MSLEAYTQLIRDRIGDDNGVVEKNIKIKFTDTGDVIYLDMASKPNRVHNEDVDSDLTIILSTSHFEQLMTKEIAGPLLLLQGKMRIRGKVSLAMKMDDILKMNKVPPAVF
jgi:putative sterol carrier protein